jgi:ribosomal protein S18 acetylase RimI-like enzyme
VAKPVLEIKNLEQIILAQAHHLEQVFHNLTASNKNLLTQGIYQWDDTYPSRALLEADIQSKTMFVLLENHQVIASVSVDTKQPAVYSEIFWNPVTSNPLMVHRLCVAPEKQGQGLGRRMLEFVETYAKEKSHDCIRVDVHTQNKAALATYENRNFKRLGEVFFPRRNVPFVCMEKVLMEARA